MIIVIVSSLSRVLSTWTMLCVLVNRFFVVADLQGAADLKYVPKHAPK